jgi:Zn-dependent M28 family amino/carboxypeptidase
MLLWSLAIIAVLILGCGMWVSQPLFSAGGPATGTVAPDALREHVKKLSVDFAPRSYRNKHNLALCVDYLCERLQAAGAAVSVQEYTIGSDTYKNVVGSFGPTSGRRVIVGAHYDAFDIAPGADDNASGVAGLLELAKLLGAESVPPALRVDIVAYCTEEPPFFGGPDMGSHRHAESLARDNVPVAAMLCLEMIGYFTDAPWSQSYPLRALYAIYPTKGNFIGVVGNTQQRELLAEVKHAMAGATDLPVYSAAMPSQVPGVDFSDQRSYWEFGFPAVMISDMAFYRNKAYHTAEDTYDRLDYTRMAKVVLGIHQAVHALAWPPSGEQK